MHYSHSSNKAIFLTLIAAIKRQKTCTKGFVLKWKQVIVKKRKTLTKQTKKSFYLSNNTIRQNSKVMIETIGVYFVHHFLQLVVSGLTKIMRTHNFTKYTTDRWIRLVSILDRSLIFMRRRLIFKYEYIQRLSNQAKSSIWSQEYPSTYLSHFDKNSNVVQYPQDIQIWKSESKIKVIISR